jgi:hypothetical protein
MEFARDETGVIANYCHDQLKMVHNVSVVMQDFVNVQ